MADSFSLRTRSAQGGTPRLTDWGVDCEYGVLRDVLLGPADNYRWLETSSVSRNRCSSSSRPWSPLQGRPDSPTMPQAPHSWTPLPATVSIRIGKIWS